MIHLFDVTKVYPPRHLALANVDLHIEKGEFVFLTGPSGAGKSTLLKLLFREEVATKGRVMVNGLDVGHLKPRHVPYLRRHIGVVFQDFRLLPQKTVYENVAFPLQVTEYSPNEIARRVPAVLEMVGLRDAGRAFPHELSGGEQQRVALARAVVTSPRILVADEPTGNLDPATARGIVDLILEINRHGTTVLMSTHAEYIVNALRKRVVTLVGGRIASDQVAGRYLYEA